MVPVFRVHGVRHGEWAACGGVLVLKESEVRALFSGPIIEGGRISAVLRAVKVALEIFKKAGPWGIVRNLAEIDSLVCDCLSVRFQLADRMESNLAVHLAQDGINKRDWLIAWW
ncbi:hypothetical protein V6N13_034672 [Hibiscus sabdariffa]